MRWSSAAAAASGHIGIQSLKALTAADVIVVDRSEGALELAKKCGADHTVLADGRQVAKVKEITGGAGCEAVIDFVGEGGAIEDGMAMLRPSRHLLRDRLWRHDQGAGHRHHLAGDQFRRQPGRHL